MKRSTWTSKTIGRSKSTYNCQENWEDRRGLFEQCRDYYDIAGRARRYTCLLHYCENYEFLCTPRYAEISGLCTFWYINFRVYELFGYVNFGYMHFRFYATLPKIRWQHKRNSVHFRLAIVSISSFSWCPKIDAIASFSSTEIGGMFSLSSEIDSCLPYL